MLLFCKKRMLKSASFDADPNIYYRTENNLFLRKMSILYNVDRKKFYTTSSQSHENLISAVVTVSEKGV